MKKKNKKLAISVFILIIMIVMTTVACAAALPARGNEAYTDSIEQMIASLVPEDGLTIKGRTYDYDDMLSFLEEIRWSPDAYVHKNHHCILSELEEDEVKGIVDFLRFIMDCPTTYTDYETVLEVQQKLNQEGYDCGIADGILGPLTFDALNAYQQEHDLREINAITEELLTDMGLEIINRPVR